MFEQIHYEVGISQQWLARQYQSFRSDDYFFKERYVPRHDISIIFHFNDAPVIINDEMMELPPVFATPIVVKSFIMALRGNMDSFVVVCKPTVFSRILGIDLSVQRNTTIQLPSAFQVLWHDLSILDTAEQRIRCLSDYIDSLLQTPYQPDIIDLFYDKIVNSSNRLLLKDIKKDFPASHRTLERNFIKRTGVSPKTLMRIVRIEYLWSKIQNEHAIDYQDMVFDGNYFDQAHFINDFKSIVGEAPNFFFNRNLYLLKLLSGRIEGQI